MKTSREKAPLNTSPMRRILQWHPSPFGHTVLWTLAMMLTLTLDYLHFRTGLAYEFHVFFAVPVVLVAWYSGHAPAIALAALAAVVWLLTDLVLGGDQADVAALAFNTLIRLIMLAGSAWVVARLRGVLEEESHLARRDPLTGLANRREFHAEGRRALALARRQGMSFTVLFLDLDRFKRVNDEQGHEVGDALLARVADTLRGNMRASDIAGRLGGDEFALLLPGMDSVAAEPYAATLRGHLLAAMEERGWPVTFSIGVAVYRQPPDELDAMLARADALMYEVKNGGRDRIMLREL